MLTLEFYGSLYFKVFSDSIIIFTVDFTYISCISNNWIFIATTLKMLKILNILKVDFA